ncbi:MAG: hypothetical protein BKP49_09045 [Treponema sp. CETP13]|nr:MAG: hypothetical protein BKP49_09045 [Treponema sp. CETP13]
MVEEPQKILFLYLNTGNGHKAIADIVKKAIEKSQNFCENHNKIYLEHGFDPKHKFTTLFYETGYRFTIAMLPGAYSLFYDVNCNPVCLNITKQLTIFGNVQHLRQLIKRYHITKIVSFHFSTSAIAERVIRKYYPQISLINTVTDPYTAHPCWFLTKKAGYIFFSKQLANQYVKKYAIKNYTIQPFPVNPLFHSSLTEPSFHSSNKKNNKFRVLIVGGGEGLRGATRITELFARKNGNIKLTVVCGRNTELKHLLNLLKVAYPNFDLTILGFVHNMHELMANSDCIISKCGASIVHEVLASGKPYIISQYIHGQELGNMRFVKKNGCGWFLKNPQKIYQKVIELQQNPKYYDKICKNIQKLNIHSDLKGITEYILKY